MSRRSAPFLSVYIVAAALATVVGALAQDTRVTHGTVDHTKSAKPENRAESVRAVLSHLGVGEGSSVADIGAGGGKDTWVIAEIVGETGTVFAEEIGDKTVTSLKKEAEKKGLSQVRAVLGRDADPCLPPGSTDLALVHHVYHHFAEPREMLRGIWQALKPGGYLVVVDKQRGTLRDWVPRHVRAEKHHWIAETTVTREAREEGFAFVACVEERWHTKDDFVLVFRRPKELQSPRCDPDPFLSLSVDQGAPMFLPLAGPCKRSVFVALGETRKLISPILKSSSSEGLEIVLEEWATQKEERPPLPANVSFPSVLAKSGDPQLGPELIDMVFFLDSYHLLFHGKTLLSKLHEKLSPPGCVYVLDREAENPLSRREASHRRMIQPEVVEREMAEAGFFLWFRGPRLAPDRFLLIFGKTQSGKISPEVDLFFGGPTIRQPPGEWLKKNYWRLRGLKTADGRFVRFARQAERGAIQIAPGTSTGTELWTIAKEKLVLSFEKKGTEYSFTDYRSLDGH